MEFTQEQPKFFIPVEAIRIDPPATVKAVEEIVSKYFDTQEKIDELAKQPLPIRLYEIEFALGNKVYAQVVWIRKTKTQLVFGAYAPVEKDDKGEWRKYVHSEYKRPE